MSSLYGGCLGVMRDRALFYGGSMSKMLLDQQPLDAWIVEMER